MRNPFRIEKTYSSPNNVESIAVIINNKITPVKSNSWSYAEYMGRASEYTGHVNENGFFIYKNSLSQNTVSVKIEGTFNTAPTSTQITVTYRTAYNPILMLAPLPLLILFFTFYADIRTINGVEVSLPMSILFSFGLIAIITSIISAIIFYSIHKERKLLEKELGLVK